jgi:hypothetical protein
MPQTLFEQAQDIMERFNFERVQRTMYALNWGWRGNGVPDLAQMKATGLQLLDYAILGYEGLDAEAKKFGYSTATGGFEARVETFSNAAPRLSLMFIVEEREGSIF